MDMLGFYEVMRRRTNERHRFGVAIANLAAVRERLAGAADGAAPSASNATFGDDVLAGAARLSKISDSLTSALRANADAVDRAEKELQGAKSRERFILITLIAGGVFLFLVALVWLFH